VQVEDAGSRPLFYLDRGAAPETATEPLSRRIQQFQLVATDQARILAPSKCEEKFFTRHREHRVSSLKVVANYQQLRCMNANGFPFEKRATSHRSCGQKRPLVSIRRPKMSRFISRLNLHPLFSTIARIHA
jgi:hypothetical protein